MTKFKKYEVRIAYCKTYETDTFEVSARNEKEAINKAWKKGLPVSMFAVVASNVPKTEIFP